MGKTMPGTSHDLDWFPSLMYAFSLDGEHGIVLATPLFSQLSSMGCQFATVIPDKLNVPSGTLVNQQFAMAIYSQFSQYQYGDFPYFCKRLPEVSPQKYPTDLTIDHRFRSVKFPSGSFQDRWGKSSNTASNLTQVPWIFAEHLFRKWERTRSHPVTCETYPGCKLSHICI